MVHSRLSLSLCLAAIVWSIAVVQAQDICQYSCVVGLYSQFCGGARCNPNARAGTEQGLCNAACLNAIGGAALQDCLASEPTFVGSTVDMQLEVLNEVETFCIAIGALDVNNDTAIPSDIADEATPSGVSVVDASIVAEGSVTIIEIPPPSAEAIDSIVSVTAIDSIVSVTAIDSEAAPDSDIVPESSPMVEKSAPACEPEIEEISAVASESEAAESSAAPSSSEEAPESDPLDSEEAVASESAVASEDAPESDEIEESEVAEESTDSEEAEESIIESEEAMESIESEEAEESDYALESEEAVESSEAAPSSSEEALESDEAAESSMEPEALPSSIIAEDADDDDLDEDVIDFLDDL